MGFKCRSGRYNVKANPNMMDTPGWNHPDLQYSLESQLCLDCQDGIPKFLPTSHLFGFRQFTLIWICAVHGAPRHLPLPSFHFTGSVSLSTVLLVIYKLNLFTITKIILFWLQATNFTIVVDQLFFPVNLTNCERFQRLQELLSKESYKIKASKSF